MDHVNCFLLKVDDDITRTGCDSLYTLNNTQSNRVQLKVYTGSWWVYIHQEEPLLGHCWEKVVGIYRNAVSAILNGTDDDTFTAVLCIFVHKRRTLADRNTIYRKRTIYFHHLNNNLFPSIWWWPTLYFSMHNVYYIVYSITLYRKSPMDFQCGSPLRH